MIKRIFTTDAQLEERLGLEGRRAVTIAGSLALLVALFFALANHSWLTARCI